MATTINAGRVARMPKGAWSISTAYTNLDIVTHNGSSWICIQSNTGNEPASGSTYWQLSAEGVDPSDYYTKAETNTALAAKQDTLVNGTNIKTINSTSVLGSGNVEINGVTDVNATNPADGTWTMTLDNGDTIVMDLNHTHSQYLKYELVNSLPVDPDSGTLYLIAVS